MPTPAPKKPTKKKLDTEAQPLKDSPVGEVPKKSKAARPSSKADLAIPGATANVPKPKKASAKKAKVESPEIAPSISASEAATPVPEAPLKGRKPAPSKAEKTEAEVVPTAVFVAAPPKAAAGMPQHGDTILTALRDGRPLEFIFLDGDANPPRTFEARQLIFDTLAQAWFVWGWDRRYNAERHHRLDALAEVNQVEGMGRSAQGPYKEGTPANLLGGWLGGDPIPVKVTLMKQWIFAVKQAPPAFPEFKITDAEDGKATVTFTATDLRAIARWCMQFGDGIQVQEPQRLVDRVKQAGIAWAGKAALPSTPVSAPPTPAATKPAHRQEEPKREPRREERHREERSDTRRETASGGEAPRPQAGPKGGAQDSKPSKANPKVEVRVERL